MKHALRKYISNCGSALFMVISTMAALILLVTAMYLSVMSQREVLFTKFQQDQAYVSATSICDMFTAYLMEATNPSDKNAKKNEKLIGLMDEDTGLAVGASAETTVATDDEFGQYWVKITRMPDIKEGSETNRLYDIAVTVNNNGVMETTHVQVSPIEEEFVPAKMPAIEQFFTATGYLPNDVYIDSLAKADSPYIFDAEYVNLVDTGIKNLLGGAGDATIRSDIICAGSMDITGSGVQIDTETFKKPLKFIIGNNFTYENGNKAIGLGYIDSNPTTNDKGQILIGGDYVYRSQGVIKNTDFYILGDAHFTSNNNQVCEGDYYIAGDLNVTGNFSVTGNVYVGGDVIAYDKGSISGNFYVGGSIINAANGITEKGDAAVCATILHEALYTHDVTLPDGSVEEVPGIREQMIEAIGNAVYPKWEVKDLPTNETKIYFNSYYQEKPAKDGSGTVPAKTFVEVINEDCTISEIWDCADNSARLTSTGYTYTIIINTGDSVDDVRKIRLQPNCADLGAGYENTFMWRPTRRGDVVNVITIGKGTLMIDIPDGVQYQSTDQSFFGHIGWFIGAGGEYTTEEGFDCFKGITPNVHSLLTDNGILHESCHNTGVCQYSEVEADDGKIYYTCKTHGGTYTEDAKKEYEDNKRDCLCAGAIDYAEFGNYVSTKGLQSKFDTLGNTTFIKEALLANGDKWEDATSTEIIKNMYFPTANIFLISCDESADIQFGANKREPLNSVDWTRPSATVLNNQFIGYIYAPYMTFISAGAGGGTLKCAGGLVVSDYIISSNYNYIFIQPTKSIEVLSNAHNDNLTPVGGRAWRVNAL